MSPTTLPIGIPRLDDLVRAQAERMANELQAVCHYPFAVQDPSLAEWEEYVDAIGGLLRDLTRSDSRDWASRALAGIVGVEVRATAPEWSLHLRETGRVQWVLASPCGEHYFGDLNTFPGQTPIKNMPTDPAAALRLALAEVCLG